MSEDKGKESSRDHFPIGPIVGVSNSKNSLFVLRLEIEKRNKPDAEKCTGDTVEDHRGPKDEKDHSSIYRVPHQPVWASLDQLTVVGWLWTAVSAGPSLREEMKAKDAPMAARSPPMILKTSPDPSGSDPSHASASAIPMNQSI